MSCLPTSTTRSPISQLASLHQLTPETIALSSLVLALGRVSLLPALRIAPRVYHIAIVPSYSTARMAVLTNTRMEPRWVPNYLHLVLNPHPKYRRSFQILHRITPLIVKTVRLISPIGFLLYSSHNSHLLCHQRQASCATADQIALVQVA